jgi:uncharacterized RDD family membrane protein YckC
MNAPAPSFAADWMQEDALTSGLLTRRVFAWVFDVCLISAICVMLWFVMAAFTVLTLGLGAPLLGLIAFIPAFYGWFWLMTPLQSSPGQALFGLVVVRDADLGPPTALQALVYIVIYGLTLALGVIWAAVALVTTRHRTLQDIASGLVVVRRSVLRSQLTSGARG